MFFNHFFFFFFGPLDLLSWRTISTARYHVLESFFTALWSCSTCARRQPFVGLQPGLSWVFSHWSKWVVGLSPPLVRFKLIGLSIAPRRESSAVVGVWSVGCVWILVSTPWVRRSREVAPCYPFASWWLESGDVLRARLFGYWDYFGYTIIWCWFCLVCGFVAFV